MAYVVVVQAPSAGAAAAAVAASSGWSEVSSAAQSAIVPAVAAFYIAAPTKAKLQTLFDRKPADWIVHYRGSTESVSTAEQVYRELVEV